MNEQNIGRQSHYLNQSVHFNPNWKEAQQHGKASRVGFSTLHGNQKRCICCLEQIQKIQIPLNEHTKQLQFLGFGFPLYYAFVRNCIFLLIVTVCSYNLMALYRAVAENKALCENSGVANHNSEPNSHNILPHNSEAINGAHSEDHNGRIHFTMRHFNQIVLRTQAVNPPYTKFQTWHKHDKQNVQNGNENKNNKLSSQAAGQNGQHGSHSGEQKGDQTLLQCTSWMIILSRIQKKVSPDQQILRGVSILIHMILLVYIKDKLIKMRDYFDERTASPSDYSAFVKRLPLVTNIRIILLKKIYQQYGIGYNKIQQIILIPDLEEFQKMEHSKEKLVEKMRKKIKNNQHDQQAKDLQNQIRLQQFSIKKHVVELKMAYQKNQLKAQKAIVILRDESIKNQLIENHSKKQFSGDGWENVIIEQAPQPRQIIWQNISLSSAIKRSRTILGWSLSILVLAILTLIFAIISKQKSIIVQQQMHKFKHEHNKTYQNQALLLVFGMIFFVVLFNKIIIANLFHIFTDLQRHASTYKFQFSFCLKYCLGLFFTTALMTLIVEAFILKNYYKHDYGVVQEQTIMYMVNSLFVPFFWIVHPIYLYKKLVLRLNKNKKHFTQQQANKMMQLPEYDVGKRYGEVLEIMWFTYLYMTLIPIGGIISSLGLALYYWVDKYNLLRRSSIRSNVSGSLIVFTLRMLNFTLVLRTAGDVLFDFQIRDGPTLSGWIFLGIAILYQFIPITALINYLNQEKFKSENTPYEIAQLNFKQSYYDEHVLFSHLDEDKNNLAQQLVNKMTRKLMKQETEKLF